MKTLITLALLAPSAMGALSALHAQTLPGSGELDDSRLRPARWEVTMTLKQGSQDRLVGTTTYDLEASADGRWVYVTSTTTDLGVATDTSVAMQRTFEPVSHRSHAVPRTLWLDYDGRRVTGRYAPADGSPREIDRVTDVPTFDAAMLDLVLGTLPLATGYRARLPMYVEEQEGLVWFDAEVVGAVEVGAVPAWDVRVTVPRYDVRFMLAKDDHRFLAGRVLYPNGAVMEMTRN
jgi:hypothetical protein